VDSVLKNAREKSGMTLEDAARKLRISPGYLHQIEKGDRGVGFDRAQQIAQIYDLVSDDLFVPIRFAARFLERENSIE